MDIVLFSGTTEGRKISEYLSGRKIDHDVCVATESGQNVMALDDFAHISVGRLNEEEICDFLKGKSPELVIDATHPYAEVVTDNLKKACDKLGICYIRVQRDSSLLNDTDMDVAYYETSEDCAVALCNETGNILLTTGSKELACYTGKDELRERIYVRVLPSGESIVLCQKAGISEKNIIAMYGPHTEEMNEALIKQFNIRHLVTKESGQTGGFLEKARATHITGIKLHVIKRPENAIGMSIKECMDVINRKFNSESDSALNINVILAGIGPGNDRLMTYDVRQAIEEADYIFGAKRMIGSIQAKGVKIAEYIPDKIIESLEKISQEELRKEINVTVLFSGDTGVYSGAGRLRSSLEEWGKCKKIVTMPGISSFSYFASVLGADYRNIHMESIHGNTQAENLIRIKKLIGQGEKVFLLMSGKSDFEILRNLIQENFDGKIVIGKNLSYPDQEIIHLDVSSLMKYSEEATDGLFIAYIYL